MSYVHYNEVKPKFSKKFKIHVGSSQVYLRII